VGRHIICARRAPDVSGRAPILPIHEVWGGDFRSFVVQSIPSPLRGVPERHWWIDFDLVVLCFITDATQDLSAVVPRHASTTLVRPFCLSCAYTHQLYHAAYLCARCQLVSPRPMEESFVWRFPNTLQREIANTRFAATFSAWSPGEATSWTTVC